MLQPLAIAHVALASGYVLHIPRVDQTYLQPALFQYLKQRYPVDPGGFHGHCLDSTSFKPFGGGDQVCGKRGEPAHRLSVPLCGHGDINFSGPNIDPRRVGVNGWRGRQMARRGLLLPSGHSISSSAMPSGPDRAKKVLSQTGSASRQKAAAVTMKPNTRSGTMLKNGLRVQAPVTCRPTCRQHGRK